MNFAAGIEAHSTMDSPSTRPRQRRTTTTTNQNERPNERSSQKAQKQKLKNEIEKIVLWRQPLNTIQFAIAEIFYLIHHNLKYLITYRKTLISSILVLCLSIFVYKTEGSHQQSIQTIEHLILWILYWLGLGIASSIGLGTGLHTFLLYLGPFIAQVTLAAYECGSIKFPRPPYPNEIICPASSLSNDSLTTNLLNPTAPISFWNILWKVKLEAFFWGLGTAFGELPPYFMARAARLGTSDDDEEDEELVEFEQLLINAQVHQSRNLSFFERLRYLVYCLIQRVGFFGIYFAQVYQILYSI